MRKYSLIASSTVGSITASVPFAPTMRTTPMMMHRIPNMSSFLLRGFRVLVSGPKIWVVRVWYLVFEIWDSGFGVRDSILVAGGGL